MCKNLAMADSLMEALGFKRVPNPKYKVGDHVYIEHCYREIKSVLWVDDHYEYTLSPWINVIYTEEDLDDA